MATVEQVYGKGAAMRLRTEKAVLEQFTVSRTVSSSSLDGIRNAHGRSLSQRLPGLPSSHVGLDTLTGADEQIEFTDFLNGAWLPLLYKASVRH
jgi:hypothetical protein